MIARRVIAPAVAMATLISTACGDGRFTLSPSIDAANAGDAGLRASSVVISPSTVTGQVGDNGSFTVVVRDLRGRIVPNPIVVWSSSDTSVATITSTGFAVALRPGSTQIRALSYGRLGTAEVTVLGAQVTSVSVSPSSASGYVGDEAQFSATALDADGNTISDRPVTWVSSDTAVVTVSAGGYGRGVGAGSAVLTATIDGVSGTSSITVLDTTTTPPPPPPAPAPVAGVTVTPGSVTVNTATSTQLSVTLWDINGNQLSGRAVSWTSSNPLVASVNSNGTLIGLVAGNATITAQSEGIVGTSTVTVTLLPPPPPPPSGGSWPNMPGTYSALTDQSFTPSLLSGWELIWNPVGNGRIADNLTAPFSASSVFEVKYPAGFNAGSAPATQYYGLNAERNVFVGMWWKANAGWQGHESFVNKLQFLFPVAGGDLYMTAYGPPNGPFQLRINLQFTSGDTRSWLVPNVGDGTVTMGDWHRIEWLVETNSGNTGVIKWWLDGVLVGDYRDVTFPAGGFGDYKLSPTWGGMGGIAKQQTDYFWFDHVMIARR